MVERSASLPSSTWWTWQVRDEKRAISAACMLYLCHSPQHSIVLSPSLSQSLCFSLSPSLSLLRVREVEAPEGQGEGAERRTRSRDDQHQPVATHAGQVHLSAGLESQGEEHARAVQVTEGAHSHCSFSRTTPLLRSQPSFSLCCSHHPALFSEYPLPSAIQGLQAHPPTPGLAGG